MQRKHRPRTGFKIIRDPLEGIIFVHNKNLEQMMGTVLKFNSKRHLCFFTEGKPIKIQRFDNNSYLLNLPVLRSQETVELAFKEDTSNSTHS